MTMRFLLDMNISTHRAMLEQGAIMSITEGQIRVRPLPLETGEM